MADDDTPEVKSATADSGQTEAATPPPGGDETNADKRSRWFKLPNLGGFLRHSGQTPPSEAAASLPTRVDAPAAEGPAGPVTPASAEPVTNPDGTTTYGGTTYRSAEQVRADLAAADARISTTDLREVAASDVLATEPSAAAVNPASDISSTQGVDRLAEDRARADILPGAVRQIRADIAAEHAGGTNIPTTDLRAATTGVAEHPVTEPADEQADIAARKAALSESERKALEVAENRIRVGDYNAVEPEDVALYDRVYGERASTGALRENANARERALGVPAAIAEQSRAALEATARRDDEGFVMPGPSRAPREPWRPPEPPSHDDEPLPAFPRRTGPGGAESPAVPPAGRSVIDQAGEVAAAAEGRYEAQGNPSEATLGETLPESVRARLAEVGAAEPGATGAETVDATVTPDAAEATRVEATSRGRREDRDEGSQAAASSHPADAGGGSRAAGGGSGEPPSADTTPAYMPEPEDEGDEAARAAAAAREAAEPAAAAAGERRPMTGDRRPEYTPELRNEVVGRLRTVDLNDRTVQNYMFRAGQDRLRSIIEGGRDPNSLSEDEVRTLAMHFRGMDRRRDEAIRTGTVGAPAPAEAGTAAGGARASEEAVRQFQERWTQVDQEAIFTALENAGVADPRRYMLDIVNGDLTVDQLNQLNAFADAQPARPAAAPPTRPAAARPPARPVRPAPPAAPQPARPPAEGRRPAEPTPPAPAPAAAPGEGAAAPEPATVVASPEQNQLLTRWNALGTGQGAVLRALEEGGVPNAARLAAALAAGRPLAQADYERFLQAVNAQGAPTVEATAAAAGTTGGTTAGEAGTAAAGGAGGGERPPTATGGPAPEGEGPGERPADPVAEAWRTFDDIGDQDLINNLLGNDAARTLYRSLSARRARGETLNPDEQTQLFGLRDRVNNAMLAEAVQATILQEQARARLSPADQALWDSAWAKFTQGPDTRELFTPEEMALLVRENALPITDLEALNNLVRDARARSQANAQPAAGAAAVAGQAEGQAEQAAPRPEPLIYGLDQESSDMLRDMIPYLIDKNMGNMPKWMQYELFNNPKLNAAFQTWHRDIQKTKGILKGEGVYGLDLNLKRTAMKFGLYAALALLLLAVGSVALPAVAAKAGLAGAGARA